MHANAERVRTTRKGDTEYIYTDHFQVFRNISAKFEKIPADASEKMPDDAMDKLEPFNYNELTAFSMPYLSGYLQKDIIIRQTRYRRGLQEELTNI